MFFQKPCISILIYFVVLTLIPSWTKGQKISLKAANGSNINTSNKSISNKVLGFKPNYLKQKDLIDLGYWILGKNSNKRIKSLDTKSIQLHISGAPGIEYSLTTGLAATAYTNFAYYTNTDSITSLSSFLVGIGYTEKHQFYIPIQSTIWTKDNKFNFQGDWRFDHYPLDTYGFGTKTPTSQGYLVSANRIRFYEFGLKHIGNNIFLGLGIQYDHRWNIQESLDSTIQSPTDFEKYGFSKSSTSLGLGLNFLYDTRKNSINPEPGAFLGNLVVRQNLKFLGSSSSWNSVLIDVRKYIQLPFHEILGLWSYNYFTINGNPPYLDLPGTATDTYGNLGRGYVQNRFIGKKMMYLEAELRYGITRNGFLGGVFFANAQTFSELNSNQFEGIKPGFGGGLRIKFNKFSRTNICLDYGFGANGSHGIFANLGEVF